MSKEIDTLAAWMEESSNIVFFGGAGVSTESGIPDFRSAAGIYQMENASPYPPEEILSRRFFDRHPDVFFDFYKTKMLHPEAQPNAAHRCLAELERAGKLSAVVTQNIDGLHQQAGSRRVLELHGSVHRNTCMECGRTYTLKDVMDSEDVVPYCNCGGIIKPDVVLYGESLDDQVIQDTVTAIARADLLVIGGTSLTVQPAAHLVTYFRGERTVLINASSTAYDNRADLLITEPIGEVLGAVARKLGLSE
ncbi:MULTISPECIES: NAD-dependent protein deacylase [Paenibacillus]|jgi:NAD-dependent deacetylase|uniref:NAD-dependent protein deacylase n=1 Tax=Paenibacillus TaxID=44249 RepID=UPI000A08F2C9|nr:MULTISPECIES: NAD-dependent protein deacylase [Paenibacillus]MDU0331750.1 NAD-dependent protein deacylase [Paenibacillus sp. 3LSP]SMF31043.1 NAD-dependent deacetylase [Paenibacillus barengoltzii]